MNYSRNINLVLEILKNEVDGDIEGTLSKMSKDYSMTWVYQSLNGDLFPTTTTNIEDELAEVYVIKGRSYDIRNICESDNVVMIELIESYPDPDTGKVYRTPQVIVLEISDGKIHKGRHYTDPRLSYLDLNIENIETNALKGTKSKIVIN